jgi:hypothetical protein
MKCSNPNCDHGIGLVSYQRGWLDKRRFCSKKCRDHKPLRRKAIGARKMYEFAVERKNSPKYRYRRATQNCA